MSCSYSEKKQILTRYLGMVERYVRDERLHFLIRNSLGREFELLWQKPSSSKPLPTEPLSWDLRPLDEGRMGLKAFEITQPKTKEQLIEALFLCRIEPSAVRSQIELVLVNEVALGNKIKSLVKEFLGEKKLNDGLLSAKVYLPELDGTIKIEPLKLNRTKERDEGRAEEFKSKSEKRRRDHLSVLTEKNDTNKNDDSDK